MRTNHILDRIFLITLCVSILFHLSAVTLFRIVVYFPRHDIEYIDIAIIESRALTPSIPLGQDRLELPNPESGLERLELAENPLATQAELGGIPSIQLPTLQFEELGLLRVRRQVLETRSRYRELFQDQPVDAWARFGRQIGSISESLTRLTHGVSPDDSDRPLPVSRPAPGYEAYLEWLSAPSDRQPLSVHPIDALWGLDATDFGEPLALLFRVDRAGDVVDVLDHVEGAGDVLEASAKALLRYRFEPLLGDGPEIQHGTLIIRAAGESE